MKLWKRDTKAWTVRQVEGEPHQGKDEEGDTCYVNTHFEHEADALERLYAEAAAFVSLAGRDIARQNAVNKLYPLMGYELRTKLAQGGAA